MDIDLSVLKSLEAEKDISMDLAIKAIEDALLVAYHRSGGVAAIARVEVDRGSGHVTVWAAETAEDGAVLREYDDTPSGFGRIAATTARNVILQRLRDVEDEVTFGEYAGREGDICLLYTSNGLDREVERNILLALQAPQHAQVNVHRESLQAPLAGARTPPGWLQRRARRNRSGGGFSAHSRCRG